MAVDFPSSTTYKCKSKLMLRIPFVVTVYDDFSWKSIILWSQYDNSVFWIWQLTVKGEIRTAELVEDGKDKKRLGITASLYHGFSAWATRPTSGLWKICLGHRTELYKWGLQAAALMFNVCGCQLLYLFLPVGCRCLYLYFSCIYYGRREAFFAVPVMYFEYGLRTKLSLCERPMECGTVAW